MNRKYLIIAIFLFLGEFFVNPILARALTIYTYNDFSNSKIGEVNTIKIFIDTEDEEINVLEGKIKINGPAEISNINTAGSIFSLWAEKPEVKNNQEINFTGGVQGGVYGKDLRLFVFDLTRKGKGQISVEPIEIAGYLNDGIGTKIENINTNMLVNPRNDLILFEILRSILFGVVIFIFIDILINIFSKKRK